MGFEVYGAIFSEVPGFVQKIYPALDPSVEKLILRECYDREAGKWKGWPGSTTEGNVVA
jgi:hypothetical protein